MCLEINVYKLSKLKIHQNTYLKNSVNAKPCRYENFKDCVDIICPKSQVTYHNNSDLNNRRYIYLCDSPQALISGVQGEPHNCAPVDAAL